MLHSSHFCLLMLFQCFILGASWKILFIIRLEETASLIVATSHFCQVLPRTFQTPGLRCKELKSAKLLFSLSSSSSSLKAERLPASDLEEITSCPCEKYSIVRRNSFSTRADDSVWTLLIKSRGGALVGFFGWNWIWDEPYSAFSDLWARSMSQG